MNHDQLLEELDLDLDAEERRDSAAGAFAPARGAALEEHVAGCVECQKESRNLQAVHRLLSASVVRPREGFTAEVMRALPPAPWEGRALVVWRWPFAMLLALGGIAAVLLGGAAAELAPATGSSGSLAAFVALARLLESAALAGAGLLGASWRGLGSGLGEWLAASKLHLGLAGGVVLALNLLLLRLLRPSSRNAATDKSR